MRGLIVAIAILAVAFGKVVDLTPDNFDSIVDGSKGAFVEFYAPWCGHCKNLAPEYEIVGEAFNRIDDVVIAKVDADAHKELGSRFDVHGFPTLKWFPKGSTTPQPYEGGRSADDIVKFVNDKAGTRARVVKPKSHITVLTDDTFDSVVLDPTKDVLVEFYAPWCGHCKSLAPTYEKLSAVYANEKNVVIANIDADAQKVKAGKYGVTGFPTLKFFPKGDKENPLSYDGGRDLPSFVSYINEKAGTHRTAEGRLAEQAGRISALDAIAARFLGADSDMVALIKEAEEAVIALTNEAEKELASYYVKVMNTIKSKGKAFLESEPTRLEKMLAGAGVTPAKVDEFTLRKNILNAFKSS